MAVFYIGTYDIVIMKDPDTGWVNSKDAALGLYNDPGYQEAKRVRQASTKNTSMVLVEEFDAKKR